MDVNILSALDRIPPDIERESWYRVLAALKAECGDAGRDIAENWSKGAESYKPSDFASTWNSLNGNGGITIGTLFHIAREFGFQPVKTAPHNDPIKLNQPAIEASRKRAETAQEARQDTHALVAMKCVERWQKATPVSSHPYLERKDIGAHGIKQEGENLLIPMMDEQGNIWSLQTIAPDGKKLFTKGSRTKGLYFRIKGEGPVVIAEGYATAVSIYEATGYHVAVSFSCHNLESVARTIRGKLPDERIIIAADSQPPATLETARKVARAIDADLAVPSEKDFNDQMQAGGSESVRTRIDAASSPEEDNGPPPVITMDEWKAARLAPDCIVENYLYADVAVKVAPGGTGKTTLELFEAIHITLGRPLYGLQIYKPGPVVILTKEDSREMLVARMRCICEALSLTPEEIEQVQRQVRIDDLCGEGVRLTEIIAEAVRPSAYIDVLAERLTDLAPVLVTIDPAVSFGIGESRVNDAEQGLVEAARRLRKALNCCARYIHHSGQAKARDKVLDQYAGRGGSAFADGSRMVHVLQPLDATEWHKATGIELEGGQNGLILARPKMSYCPPQEPIYLRRRGYLFEDVQPIASDPEAQLRRDARRLLEVLPTLTAPTQNTLVAADTGIPQQRTRVAVRWMLERGQLEYVDSKQKGGPQSYLRACETPICHSYGIQ